MARSVREVEAAAIAEAVSQTGDRRANTIAYYRGAIAGNYGPVSRQGTEWCRRILAAMGAY